MMHRMPIHLRVFPLPLPCLLPHPPRHVQQRARESLRSLIACLDGYWTTRDQVNNALKTLLAAVKEPALAFADFEDVLSTIENKLPEEMKKELHQAMEDHSSFPRGSATAGDSKVHPVRRFSSDDRFTPHGDDQSQCQPPREFHRRLFLFPPGEVPGGRNAHGREDRR